VSVDSLARWLVAIRNENHNRAERIRRANDDHGKLERDARRASERRAEVEAAAAAAKDRRAESDAAIPAAVQELAQRRREAEPTRSGAGIRVFLSHRPETADEADRLTGDLKARLGADRILGSEPVPPGAGSEAVIRGRIERCDVLLAMIGPGWLTDEDANGRRLTDPENSGRLETEAALERELPIIPVLAQNAALPERDALPVSLRPLLAHQAFLLPDQFWDSAVERLVDRFEKIERSMQQRERAVTEAAERLTELERSARRAQTDEAEAVAAIKSAQDELAALEEQVRQAKARAERLRIEPLDENAAFIAGPSLSPTAATR
jgi:hypothetical protein